MFVLLALYLLCPGINSEAFLQNSTYFGNCKVEYSISQASYTKFFEITEEHRINSTLIFDFHFSVLAPSDAHILLATSNKVTATDPVYEIVLGAGKNTFSEIRRLQKSAVKASSRTKNILSALDIKSFWIHISSDGLLEVGREDADVAVLSFRDPNPLDIRTFSFCTWPGVDAKWYYDCQREQEGNSTEIEKPLTNQQRLDKYLFEYYDLNVRPVIDDRNYTFITIRVDVHHVNLDEIKSALSVRGTLTLSWLDEKINWNPDEFGGIQDLRLERLNIWTPNLVILNSLDLGVDYATKHFLCVNSEGSVQYRMGVIINTWCDTSDMSNWPLNEHACDIQFGYLTHRPNIIMDSDEHKPSISNIKSHISEWQVLNISTELVSITLPWNTNDSSAFIVRMDLRRFINVYNCIYFTPLVAVAASLLSTFLVSPFGPYKISLNCFQMIVLSFFMVRTASLIPAHPKSVPKLVLLYTSGIFGTLVSLLFTIVIVNWTRTEHKKPLPRILHRALSSEQVKSILYIHATKVNDNYDKLVDDTTRSTVRDVQQLWTMLGVALDRLLFLVFLIIVFVAFVKYY